MSATYCSACMPTTCVWRRCCPTAGRRRIPRRSSITGWKNPEPKQSAPVLAGRIAAPAAARVLSAAVGVGGLWLYVQPEPTLARLAVVITLATVGYVLPLVVGSSALGVRLLTVPARWLSIWRDLARQLWPFMLLFSCSQLLFRVDPSLLEWMGGEPGLLTRYGLAFKWVEGLFFLPYVVASAAIPALVAAARDLGHAAAHRILLRVAAALAAGTIATSAGLLVVGEPVLVLLVGANFEPSIPLYRVFCWLLPIHSLGVFFAAGLIAQGAERRVLAITVLAAIVGLAVKIIGFTTVGVDLFAAGVFAGVVVHVFGCGLSLWRQPATA